MIHIYLTLIDVAKHSTKVVTAVYAPQQYMRVLVVPHPCQHLIFSIFFVLATLVAINDCKCMLSSVCFKHETILFF